VIRAQSLKLGRVTSVNAWNNGPYGNVLKIVNEETLHKLNKIWSKYANASDAKDAGHKQFRDAVDKIFNEHHSPALEPEYPLIHPLTRSFGLMAIHSIQTSKVLMQQFWSTGVADKKDIPNDPILNPLFIFSSAAGDKFALSHEITPLAIFHFAQQSGNQSIAAAAVATSAKKQFEDWCKAFLRSKDSIVIRFVVADPITLCVALKSGRKMPSTPWSESMLVFDELPLQFNVIDTSTLCDHVGAVNILVATVPLMQNSPVTTIQMESTSRPWSEETLILQQFLLSDVTFMCNVLGLAPIPYLTGITTRGLLQDVPILFDFSGDRPAPGLRRVVWKIPSSGDSRITEPPTLTFDAKDFVKFIVSIYEDMFIRPQQPGSPQGTTKPHYYTPASFAALLAFLRPRISVDWDLTMSLFLEELESPFLPWQAYLCGAGGATQLLWCFHQSPTRCRRLSSQQGHTSCCKHCCSQCTSKPDSANLPEMYGRQERPMSFCDEASK
jgi:hypothetical protein